MVGVLNWDWVTTFSRRDGKVTDGLQEFAAAIAASPADPVVWLVMADWLDEQGHAGPAAVVRALWDDNAEPADGTISRGYYQWENGGQHWVGVRVEAKEGRWFHAYWANGNWRAEASRKQAQNLMGSLGKPYHIRKRTPWTGDEELIEGVTPYTGLHIEC